jgi:Uma2 family endonuclease
MAVLSPPQPIPLPLPRYPVRTFTVDEYHRMIQAGILTEEDPVELLEGWIVPKMARNPLHDSTIQRLNRLLGPLLPAGWDARPQCAITTADSEPEPDFTVVRGDDLAYQAHHPGPPDLGVVLEVSDSSLARDRDDKGRLYARAGIVCYWIVNLVDRRLEVYTDPTGPDPSPAYRRRQDYGPADVVPLVLDGAEVARVAVRDLLP